MYYVFYTFVQIPLEMNLNQKRHLNDVYTESIYPAVFGQRKLLIWLFKSMRHINR